MKIRKILSLLLCLVLVVSLFAGCSKEESTEPGANKPGASANAPAENETKYAYKAEFTPLTTHTGEKLDWVNSYVIVDGKLFYAANYIDGKIEATNEVTGEPILDPTTGEPMEYDNYVYGLFVMDPATQEVSLMEGYELPAVPEGMQGSSYIQDLFAGSDGTLWVNEEMYTYSFDLPEGFDSATMDPYEHYVDGGSVKMLSQYSTDGEKLKTITIQEEENTYFNSMHVMADGRTLAYDYEKLYVFDQSGNVVKTIATENTSGRLSYLGNDEYGFVCYNENGQGQTLKKVDLEQGKLVDTDISVPATAYELMPGHGEYVYLYQSSDSVFGVKEDGTPERLFSWMECDINANNIEDFSILDDGTVVAMEMDHMEGRSNNFVMMKPVDRSELPVKEELVLACMGLGWDMRSTIVEFNRSRDDVRINVRDYSELVTDGDYVTAYNAALQKLTTEILSGNGPDIIATGDLPVDQYISKGLLMDLWPLIDSDPDISREDLMTHLFDVMSVDGKLYEVTDTFSIQTAVVDGDIADGRTGWTLEELLEALDELPDGASILSRYMDSQNILRTMISYDLDQFMDWNTGTCSFDSEDFIDILNFSKEFPKEFDYETIDWETEESEYSRIKSGKQLMMDAYMSSYQEIQLHVGIFDGNASYIGYPTSTGTGSAFNVYDCMAITSNCKNVDAAWSLVRTLLLEENQISENMYQFPTNKNAFDEYTKQAMTPEYSVDPETGEQVEISMGGIGFDDFMVDLYAVKQEEYDAFWAAYEGCERVASSNNEVMELINGHTGAFFDGQKTAEETAKLIQDSVSLYMMEQG